MSRPARTGLLQLDLGGNLLLRDRSIREIPSPPWSLWAYLGRSRYVCRTLNPWSAKTLGVPHEGQKSASGFSVGSWQGTAKARAAAAFHHRQPPFLRRSGARWRRAKSEGGIPGARRVAKKGRPPRPRLGRRSSLCVASGGRHQHHLHWLPPLLVWLSLDAPARNRAHLGEGVRGRSRAPQYLFQAETKMRGLLHYLLGACCTTC